MTSPFLNRLRLPDQFLQSFQGAAKIAAVIRDKLDAACRTTKLFACLASRRHAGAATRTSVGYVEVDCNCHAAACICSLPPMWRRGGCEILNVSRAKA